MIFIHKGKGKLRTMMGNIPFEYGDYLIIPRGLSIKLILKHHVNRFYVESLRPFYTPKRYKNLGSI
jgi:homogentisate 1,2-dioxygenase